MMKTAEQIVPTLSGLFDVIESTHYRGKQLLNTPLSGLSGSIYNHKKNHKDDGEKKNHDKEEEEEEEDRSTK